MSETKEAVLPGWARVLSYAAPAAGLGALGGAVLPSMAKRRAPSFTPEEEREFGRHGLDPNALKFYQTLAGLMRGMKAQRQMMESAFAGKPEPVDLLGGAGSPMDQYA